MGRRWGGEGWVRRSEFGNDVKDGERVLYVTRGCVGVRCERTDFERWDLESADWVIFFCNTSLVL